jgi:DNA-binding HxlR family transcriptional regulator
MDSLAHDERLSRTSLVIHPVRLRIVQAFLNDRVLTTRELARELPSLPQATLYRQVATLVAGGALEIVGERQVRGSVERSYRLRRESASFTRESVEAMSHEEQRDAFTTFLGTLVSDFDRTPHDTPSAFVQLALHLTEPELTALNGELTEVLARYVALPAAHERRRFLMSTVLTAPAERRLS